MCLDAAKFGLQALLFVKQWNDLGFLELGEDLGIGDGCFELLLGLGKSAVNENENKAG